MVRSLPWAILLLAATACDPTGKAAGEGGAAPSGASASASPAAAATSTRGSRELESCARTADCDGALRCVAGACRPELTSVVGELEAAAGDRAIEAGRLPRAAEHYGRAVARYEADGLPVPAGLLCRHGRALVAARGDATKLELGARLLHRCLLAAPPGSPPRQAALAELAALLDAGLDPAAIARPQPADLYLGGKPAQPSIDQLKVAIEGDGKTAAGGYRDLVAKLAADPAARAPLAACWQSWAQSSGATALRLTFGVKHGYRLDEDDDFERAVVELSPPADGDAATRAAATCAKAALQPLADAIIKKRAEETRWQASLTVSFSG